MKARMDVLLDDDDVDALARLLPAMVSRIDTGHALLRGRYTVAVARMEHAGTPVDTGTLDRLRGGWDRMKTELIARVDGDYGVFDGATFKHPSYDREKVATTLGREGSIAVQVHGGKSWPKGAKVRWRNVRIKEL